MLVAHKMVTFSPERQKETLEVVDFKSQFLPTKIMIKSRPIVGYLLNNFRRYIAGEERLYPKERSQIGLRIISRMKLDTIYGVDVYLLHLEWNDELEQREKDSYYFVHIVDRHYFEGEDDINQRYQDLYKNKDSMVMEKSGTENRRFINPREYMQ